VPKLTFKGRKTVEVPKGTSILEAAMENGVPMYHTCGGNCSCSTCRIVVLKGAEHLSAMEPDEAQILDSFDLKAPHRLGCQAVLKGGDVEVEIPSRERAPRDSKILPVPPS
jgi:ferredoxin